MGVGQEWFSAGAHGSMASTGGAKGQIAIAATVAGDNRISASEALAGVHVRGTATGYVKGTIVRLRLAGHDMFWTGTVDADGNWDIVIPDFASRPDGGYRLVATVGSGASAATALRTITVQAAAAAPPTAIVPSDTAAVVQTTVASGGVTPVRAPDAVTLSVHAAVRASDFTSSIGINTALSATTSAYGNLARVEYGLAFLGITNVRDAFVTEEDVYAFRQLNSQLGVRFDFHLEDGTLGTEWQIAQMLANPGLIRFVEGPNETDNVPSNYAGLTGFDATAAEQAALFNTIRGNAALASTPVIQASFAQVASFYATGNWSGISTFGNAHQYYADGDQPSSNIATYLMLAQMVSPGQSVVATESGYYTLPSADGVNEAVQAKYTLNLLFDDWQAGINMTYLFELLDEFADPTASNGHWHFGLFDSAGAAKPAATAVHNLMALLNDPGSAPAGASLTYGIEGMPTNGRDMLLAKSNGDFILAVWNDAKLWNGTTATAISVPNVPITVTLGQAYQTITVYDPLTGTAPIASFSNASQFTLSLPDHPLLVKVSNAAVPQLGALQPVVTAQVNASQVSGNLWTTVIGNLQESVSAYTSGLTITSVNTTGSRGTVTLNAATKVLTYRASAYNPLLTTDTFAYTASDGHGGTVSGTLRMVIAPPANTIYGMRPGGEYYAPAAGWTVYAQATGQTLLGSAAGGATFFGLGDTTIAADGLGNTISVTAGNHVIATGTGNAKVTLADGNNTLFGAGTGDVITGGKGNTIVLGNTGATRITLGDGNQSIGLSGTGNTVSIGTGSSVVDAGSGSANVTVGGGVNQISIAGTANTVRVKGGTNTIGSSGSASTFQFDAGANTLYAAGSGNKITGGNGSTVIWGSTGTTSVTLGSGNNQIQLGGGGNTVTLGAGQNFVDAGSGGGSTVTMTGGTSQVTIGGSKNTVTLNGGAHTVIATTTASVFTAKSGTNTIWVTGTTNTITGGAQDDTIVAMTGNNTLTSGAGTDRIQFAGTANTVKVGIGTTYLYDSGSANTIALGAVGTPTTQVYGAVMTNGDKFDLRPLLAGTNWTHTAADLTRVLSVATAGTDTILTVKPTGSATGSYAAAAFHDTGPFSLSAFLAKSITA